MYLKFKLIQFCNVHLPLHPFLVQNVVIFDNLLWILWFSQRIYNDKADSYPQHDGKFFNFRIFIDFFHSWSKENIKVLGIGAIFVHFFLV